MSKQSKRAAFARRQKNIRHLGYDRKSVVKRVAVRLAEDIDAEVYRRALGLNHD